MKTVSEPAGVALTTILSMLVIVNVVGNSLVCVVIIRNQDMRTPMNYLLVNLALADMMLAVFITPQFILIHTFKHPHGMPGTLLCKLLTGGNLMWIGASSSAFTLVVVAFERYYAVMYPYDNKGKLTKYKLKVIVPAIWISSLFLNAPSFFTKYFSEHENFCMQHWPEGWMAKAYGLTWLVLLGALPMISMAFLYSRVVYSLWIKREEQSNATQKGVMRVRKRVTKMVVAVSIIYGLCWTPDVVIYALILFSSKYNFGDTADIISIVLVVCNSTVNPVIYAYMNSHFRKHIKALLCGSGADGNRVHAATKDNEATETNVGPTPAILQRDVHVIR